MFRQYYPCEYAKSVYEIDYKRLYAMGVRGLIFDIDNTIVHHNDDATPEAEQLFRDIHAAGLKTVLLSNNDEERVQRFIRNIDTPYVCDAEKPQPQGYERALEILGTDKQQTVVIGDQMFVDIIGANRVGIPSILVHYIPVKGELWLGFKRYIEMAVLVMFRLDKKQRRPIGTDNGRKNDMPAKKRKLFCEISPTTYAISEKKSIILRHIRNYKSNEVYARGRSKKPFPCLISSCSSHLIKKGKGIDPVTQQNKATNIRIACERINGLVIRPGETFSFWQRVGNTTARKGYKEGRVLILGKLTKGLGGGLCNLANTIHRVVLQSPLTDTEFHMHSDALAPDEGGVRVPMSAGTSVNYNYEDYRFRNDTEQDIQLLAWCDDENLFCEIRSKKPFPDRYEISEEDHHFEETDGTFYRCSRIYKDTYDKKTGELKAHELIVNNRSEVLFDPEQIPEELKR